MRRRGICVIVPTYNNASTIHDVITECKKQCDDVIVVNDGSTDTTASILSGINGVMTVTLSENSGKGTALKQGFLYAKKMGFAYAITIDGDGQHFPDDIGRIVQASIKYPGALIIGQRTDLAAKERSGGSKFANSFSNLWFSIQTLRYVHDTQSGFRLYPLYKMGYHRFITARYEAELELMVFAAWHGIQLVSVPVKCYYPPKEQRVSHFRPIADFARITVLNTVLCILAIVYGWPRILLRTICTALRTVYSLVFFGVFSMMIMTPLAYIYLHLGRVTQHRRYGLHCILHFMANLVMNVHTIPGARYRLDNNPKEDFRKPAMIICNHQSHIDLMPLLALHRKIIVLTNERVWRNLFYGYVIRNAEFYPVSEGIESLEYKLRDLVMRGYSIAVYPEGTRSADCSIGRFHKGAFHIARQLDLDIIPLILYGAGRVLPKKGNYLRKGIIRLTVDNRITVEQIKGFESVKKMSSWFRQYYIRRYEEICDKLDKEM